jgi:prepilin signal peptidase PulO-like enzyme (type II secretory pathway)
VEVATGLLFVAALFRVGVGIDLWLLLILLSTYVIIFVYDVRHYIIPDMLTAFVLLITLLLTAPRSLAADPWLSYGIDVLAAMLGALFLFSLWFVSKGTWLGFGDVKLAVPLGLLVGASLVFSFIVVSFWVGAALSLVLIGAARLTRGQLRLPFLPRGLTIKSVVPFAPFLISGALIVYFTAFDVLTIFTF